MYTLCRNPIIRSVIDKFLALIFLTYFIFRWIHTQKNQIRQIKICDGSQSWDFSLLALHICFNISISFFSDISHPLSIPKIVSQIFFFVFSSFFYTYISAWAQFPKKDHRFEIQNAKIADPFMAKGIQVKQL